jgi:hypothetical protein
VEHVKNLFCPKVKEINTVVEVVLRKRSGLDKKKRIRR